MPSFPEPTPKLNYSLATEKTAINNWFTQREVPESKPKKLLVASWNVANLGEQKRSVKDLKLIAHLMSRFDLIAVQEIKTDFSHLASVVDNMTGNFDWVINDPGGNSERLAFIYRTNRVKLGRMFAEIAVPAKDFVEDDVVVSYKKSGKTQVEVYYRLKYTPFDRNPFVGAFESGKLKLTLANVHLYFGAFKNASKQDERAKFARRVMEILQLAAWAKKRRKSKKSYDQNVILLGDMNVPMMSDDDAAFRALKKSGFKPCDYSKAGGSNLSGTKTYDQVAVAPGPIQDRLEKYGVFDFDNGIFKAKWNDLVNQHGNTKKANTAFNQYVRFYMSDHRPLWMQLKTD